MSDWDGTERRQVVLADERTRSNGSGVEVPAATLIVGFAAVVLMQVAALIGHAVLSRDQLAEREEAREARRQISCFVVGITQGKPGADLLTSCGFIKVGGQ